MVAPTIVITAITKHLSEDKELQSRLRNDRSLLPAAIEEFIRLHVPYRGFSRTAVTEEEISGTKVPPRRAHYCSVLGCKQGPSAVSGARQVYS